MAKILVTFIVNVETDNPAEAAKEAAYQMDFYEGWQIFGEKGILEDSTISDVTATVMEG